MSKGAKFLRLAEWRPWRPWRPWFGKVAKKVLSKLLLLLKAANTAKKMATRAHARELWLAARNFTFAGDTWLADDRRKPEPKSALGGTPLWVLPDDLTRARPQRPIFR